MVTLPCLSTRHVKEDWGRKQPVQGREVPTRTRYFHTLLPKLPFKLLTTALSSPVSKRLENHFLWAHLCCGGRAWTHPGSRPVGGHGSHVWIYPESMHFLMCLSTF